MQYRTGQVTVTQNSNIVTGIGTNWLTTSPAITPNHTFKVLGENANYTINAVDTDTRLQLSVPYAGTTKTVNYLIVRDFTPHKNLPEVYEGDADWAYTVTQALRKLDTEAIIDPSVEKITEANGKPLWNNAEWPSSNKSEASSKDISQALHGFVVGNVVRLNGSSYVKAQANSDTNAEVVGIVSVIKDANNFTLVTGGYVSGLTGLVAGTLYYLSADTAGAITSVEPTGIGQVSRPVLIADSTTSGHFYNWKGSGSGGHTIYDSNNNALAKAAGLKFGDGFSVVNADNKSVVSGVVAATTTNGLMSKEDKRAYPYIPEAFGAIGDGLVHTITSVGYTQSDARLKWPAANAYITLKGDTARVDHCAILQCLSTAKANNGKVLLSKSYFTHAGITIDFSVNMTGIGKNLCWLLTDDPSDAHLKISVNNTYGQPYNVNSPSYSMFAYFGMKYVGLRASWLDSCIGLDLGFDATATTYLYGINVRHMNFYAYKTNVKQSGVGHLRFVNNDLFDHYYGLHLSNANGLTDLGNSYISENYFNDDSEFHSRDYSGFPGATPIIQKWNAHVALHEGRANIYLTGSSAAKITNNKPHFAQYGILLEKTPGITFGTILISNNGMEAQRLGNIRIDAANAYEFYDVQISNNEFSSGYSLTSNITLLNVSGSSISNNTFHVGNWFDNGILPGVSTIGLSVINSDGVNIGPNSFSGMETAIKIESSVRVKVAKQSYSDYWGALPLYKIVNVSSPDTESLDGFLWDDFTKTLTVQKQSDTGYPAIFERYSNTGAGANLCGRKARGTITSPASILLDDVIFGPRAEGFDGSGFVIGGTFAFRASENWDSLHKGTSFEINTVSNGGTNNALRMKIGGDGNTTFFGNLTASSFIGDGSQLTNVGSQGARYGNLDFTINSADTVCIIIGGAGNVIVPAASKVGRVIQIVNEHSSLGTIYTNGGYTAGIAYNESLWLRDTGTAWEPQSMPVPSAAAAGTSGLIQFNNGSNTLSADSNLYWDNVNKRMGLGTSIPSVDIHISTTATTNQIRCTPSGLSSATGGGIFSAYHTDGAAISSGDRLLSIFAGGSRNASNTLATGVGIEVFAAGDWSDTSAPAEIIFKTCPPGSLTRVERLKIKSTGILNIANTPNYADNATAKANGLVDGDLYRNGDHLMIAHA